MVEKNTQVKDQKQISTGKVEAQKQTIVMEVPEGFDPAEFKADVAKSLQASMKAQIYSQEVGKALTKLKNRHLQEYNEILQTGLNTRHYYELGAKK